MTNCLVRKLRHGAVLTPEDVERLEAVTRQNVERPAHSEVIAEQANTEYVHVLKSGVACRYKHMPNGDRAILALLLPGDFCDLHVAVLDRMDHSIGTLVDSEISLMSRAETEEMLRTHPNINRACQWATLVDEAILREWLVNVGRRATSHQLAHLFCELYLRMSAVGLTDGYRFTMPFTQATLGDMIGVTPVHVQRRMSQLQQDGWIALQDRVISLPDFEGLAEIADFDPTYLHLTQRQSSHAIEGPMT